MRKSHIVQGEGDELTVPSDQRIPCLLRCAPEPQSHGTATMCSAMASPGWHGTGVWLWHGPLVKIITAPSGACLRNEANTQRGSSGFRGKSYARPACLRTLDQGLPYRCLPKLIVAFLDVCFARGNRSCKRVHATGLSVAQPKSSACELGCSRAWNCSNELRSMCRVAEHGSKGWRRTTRWSDPLTGDQTFFDAIACEIDAAPNID
ncbi:hypothetical protein PspTeo4_13136 [Pseudomonas sp. Teo4]|nr:hypothetical protein [Pseudomonas sp. Teo4]